jgi:transportin-3
MFSIQMPLRRSYATLLTLTRLYFTQKLAESELFAPIFEAAVAALALEQYGPLSMTLHYIRDVIAYAGNNPPQSSDTPNAPTIQHAVQQLLLASGERLVSNIMVGMMITFPDDVFADGSGALLGLFEILPQETTTWVDKTVRLLPAGTVSEVQIDKLLANIRVCLASRDDSKRVRRLLQDFTNSYRRRNIAPRDGLGDLAATRFRWGG